MRNLLEYPMTYEEAMAVLDKVIESLNNENRIGDVRAYALDWLKEKIVEHKDLFE